jgi:hypothetical protein
MTSFRGQASSAKMTSLGGKLTALACHPTKRASKAEELTYLSTNIVKKDQIPSIQILSLGFQSVGIWLIEILSQPQII